MHEPAGCGPNISLEQLMTKRSLILAVSFESREVLGEGKSEEAAMENMASNDHDPEADDYFFYAVPAELNLIAADKVTS